MATMRLNNSIREAITRKALIHRFRPEVKSLLDKGRVFGDAVYRDIFNAETRNKIDSLPEGWLPEAPELRVAFQGKATWVYKDGRGFSSYRMWRCIDEEPATSESWRVLADDRRKARIKSYGADSKLCENFESLEREKADLEEKIKAVENVLRAALDSVHTVGAVLRDWPELKPFLPAPAAKKNLLPAIPASQMNAMLDLPVS